MKASVCCSVVSVVTPKQFQLDGLWFGPEKAERVLIFIHGLTSSLFAHQSWLTPLVDDHTAILFFNNRGHNIVAKVRKLDKRKLKGSTTHQIGQAFEVFTDSADDLEGAVRLAESRGAKEIFLVGHSTGCQKAVYYASRRGKQRRLAGLVLICPMSDYAALKKENKPEQWQPALTVAKQYMESGKPHRLLPTEVWPQIIDAQRFMSLFTPDSEEEIFSYAQPEKRPETYLSIHLPILSIFAGQDEYRDRPIPKIVDWFARHHRSQDYTAQIIKDADHGFAKGEVELKQVIRQWLAGQTQ